jgi:hypothetical protein
LDALERRIFVINRDKGEPKWLIGGKDFTGSFILKGKGNWRG